eukprot:TRINITY_DN10498_c0_g1_i1.p1 TRINITY_DN10498_c0_g1~~TRINITY_DN10498_c0_g1_i1.p1  ORF type:complete len:278 (-),score=49.48 TRINITY_DN10498_c0_g1_i1:76-909(-)
MSVDCGSKPRFSAVPQETLAEGMSGNAAENVLLEKQEVPYLSTCATGFCGMPAPWSCGGGDIAAKSAVPVMRCEATLAKTKDLATKKIEDRIPGPSCTSTSLDELSEAGDEEEVWLHIYDLDAVTSRLNDMWLRSANLGAFHCGVEVLGEEWFFAWGETDQSGVIWTRPRNHSVHIYSQSIRMGTSPLSESEIKLVLYNASLQWRANTYHPINRNCVTFAEALLKELQVDEPFPAWVRGAADAGKSSLIFPLADYSWQWMKWWSSSGTQTPASTVSM